MSRWLCLVALLWAAAPAQGSYISDVASQVICPCEDDCMKVLEVCACGDAGRYRAEIDSMLVSGDDVKEAREAFIGHYGERFRAAPRAWGGGLLLWVLPLLFLLVGLVAVSRSVRKWAGLPRNKEISEDLDNKGIYGDKFENELKARDE